MKVKSQTSTFLILKIILYLLLFNISLEQCVLGGNCPFNQGECVADTCNCLSGFYSLLDPQLPPAQQTYCNYEQINVYAPIILEVFMPSFGHFYVGNYSLGIFKLGLLVIYICSSVYLYKKVKMPYYMRYVIEKYGPAILALIGLKLGEEKEEEKEEEPDTKDLAVSVLAKELINRFRSNQSFVNQEEGINRGETSQMKQIHDDEEGIDFYNLDVKEIEGKDAKYEPKEQFYDPGEKPEISTNEGDLDKPDNEKPLIDKEDKESNADESESGSKKEKEPEREEDKNIKLIFELSSIIFSIFYFADLLLYKFKVYNDGFGVPLVE